MFLAYRTRHLHNALINCLLFIKLLQSFHKSTTYHQISILDKMEFFWISVTELSLSFTTNYFIFQAIVFVIISGFFHYRVAYTWHWKDALQNYRLIKDLVLFVLNYFSVGGLLGQQFSSSTL